MRDKAAELAEAIMLTLAEILAARLAKERLPSKQNINYRSKNNGTKQYESL